MKRVLLVLLLISFFRGWPAVAEEGMWIPLLLEKYNIGAMTEMGFRLSAEDIYSVNRASMKDAVMVFGSGCTAELISGEGLIITNHHCGLGRIQSHSTIEHDYLTDGFWAMSGAEELPNPGLTVTFLKYMEDVTGKVLSGLDQVTDAARREEIFRKNSVEILREAVRGTHYRGRIVPFFGGNQYFLFVTEVFTDVRLVGAPPASIGKFGGDTDNWAWPRHTGDFCLFRIYAGPDNKPAEYSPENKPYRPVKFFPVSLKGVRQGDFTMVFGYPGSTNQYAPSNEINMLQNELYPFQVKIREKKLDVLVPAMDRSAEVRIKYTAKTYNGVSNSWKKWKGEISGLGKVGALDRKFRFEKAFSGWVESAGKAEYSDILPGYDSIYPLYARYSKVRSAFNEVFYRNGIEVFSLASQLADFALAMNKEDKELNADELKRIRTIANSFFNDVDMNTDRDLFASLIPLFTEMADPSFHPPELIRMRKKFRNDPDRMADWYYSVSFIPGQERLNRFLDELTPRKAGLILKDPFVRLILEVDQIYRQAINPVYEILSREIGNLDTRYMKAQMEFQPDRVFYPDANSTLRVSFGQVKGSQPADGIVYKHYTTLEGIIEKDNPGIYDYRVPGKLKELYLNKDYGRYGQDGEMPVCFLATNHTTGGNSGSPVINADGHLVGVNFDRVWEGVQSDLVYNPDLSRNISLDIRYALFVIDKLAGAGYLLDEMEIIE